MNKTLNFVVILIFFVLFMACFIHTRDYTILISIPFFVFAILDNFGEKFISRIFFIIAFILFALRWIAGVLQIY